MAARPQTLRRRPTFGMKKGVDDPLVNRREKKDIKKRCMTWMPILRDKLLLLFVRRRTRDALIADTSPVYDGNSLLDDQSLHEHNLLPEYDSILLSDPNCGSSPHCLSVPLLFCSPLNRPFHLGNHSFDRDSHPNLCLLPDDIVINILSRLDCECVLVCRRVAKSFRDLMSCHTYNHTLLTRSTPVVVIQWTSLWCKTYDAETKLRDYHVMLR